MIFIHFKKKPITDFFQQLSRKLSPMINKIIEIYLNLAKIFAKITKRKLDKRSKIIEEIIDTERSYVSSLQTLSKYYIYPLKGGPSNDIIDSISPNLGRGFISSQDIHTIFPASLEIIQKTNEELLQRLEKRLKSRSRGNIGDIFLEIAPFFRCYTAYVNNFDASLSTYRSGLKTSRKFRQFIELQHKTPGVDYIDSLMIMPVQRIPRYVLLIKELLKNTDQKHHDFVNLQNALKSLEEVAMLMNKTKELTENLDKVFKIEKETNLEHDLTRKWVKEGQLIYIPNNSNQRQNLYCWLFSDCFVAAKSKTSILKKLEYSLEINLSLITIDKVTSTQNGFMIVTSSNTYSFAYLTTDNWVSFIQNSVCNARNSLTTFEEVSRNSRSSLVETITTPNQNTNSKTVYFQ